MNCHRTDKEKQGAHGHSPLNHMLHMVICCGLPIIIVAFLPLISRISPNTGNFVGKVTPYLCPILMIPMMFMMLNGNRKKDCCDNTSKDSDSNEIGQLAKPLE